MTTMRLARKSLMFAFLVILIYAMLPNNVYANDSRGLLLDQATITIVDAEYKLVYNPNGGVGNPVEESHDPGKVAVKSNMFIRPGYVFVGWSVSADGSGEKYIGGDKVEFSPILESQNPEELILYAQWQAKPDVNISVNFDSNGGTAVDPLRLDQTGTIDIPKPPIKEGYIFDGWYTDKELKDEWNFGYDEVTGDMTLYAKWDEVTGDMTLYAKWIEDENPGTGDGGAIPYGMLLGISAVVLLLVRRSNGKTS